MTYVNVRINNNFDVVVKIDKDKYNVGTPVIVQSKDDLEYGVITRKMM